MSRSFFIVKVVLERKEIKGSMNQMNGEGNYEFYTGVLLSDFKDTVAEQLTEINFRGNCI